MTSKQEQLRSQLMKQDKKKVTSGKVGQQFYHLPATVENVRGAFSRLSTQFAALMPDRGKLDRLTEHLILSMARTPRLQECTLSSVIGAFGNAVAQDLVPNDPTYGHCWIIPHNNYNPVLKKKVLEATFIMGFQGCLLQMHRHGGVADVFAANVYAGDEFEYVLGDEPKLKHIPNLEGDGDYYCTYAIARMKDGTVRREVIPRQKMQRIQTEALGKSDRGPWSTWPDEMRKKTAIKALAKRWPQEPGKSLFSDSVVVRASEGDLHGETIIIDQSEVEAVEVVPNDHNDSGQAEAAPQE